MIVDHEIGHEVPVGAAQRAGRGRVVSRVPGRAERERGENGGALRSPGDRVAAQIPGRGRFYRAAAGLGRFRRTVKCDVVGLRDSGWGIRALYGVALAAAIPLIAWNGLVEQVGSQLTDILMRSRAPVRTAAVRKVLLVAIDDGTASRYGPLPLRRSVLAAGLERLARCKPDVVSLDLLISEPANPADDASLERALGRFPRAVVSAALDTADGSGRWILPFPALAARAATAHVHAAQDPDGTVRSVLLEKAGGGRRFWAFALETVRLSLHAQRPVEKTDSIGVGPIEIPTARDQSRMMLINYAGPEGAYERVPFSSLVDGTAPEAAFRDRIVVIGVTAQGSGDRLFTPVSSYIGMSGIEIHANAIRTMLDRAFLVPLGPGGEYVAYGIIALLCLLLARSLRGVRLVLALVAAAMSIPVACAAALRFGSVWPLGSMGAVFLLSSLIAGAGEYGVVWMRLRDEERKRKEYAFRVQAIAHEIKTPLTAIQGSSEIISHEMIPEGQRAEMAGLIHKESKRLTSIIEAFLNVERMAAGTLSLEKRAIEAQPFFDEVLERARLYAARKRIAIESDIRVSGLEGDPDLLSFAVYNLLTNAVKYSAKGTNVRLSANQDAGNTLVSVQDQGYGIASSEQERIFERFYRLKRDERGPETGTGIGLALVREIVTQHGGQVKLDSRPGVGSRFTLVLPA